MDTKDKILEILGGGPAPGVGRELQREEYRPVRFYSSGRFMSCPDSDIDVLVEFHMPIGLPKFIELKDYLSERLGGKVDLVSKKALKPVIGKSILSEVIMA